MTVWREISSLELRGERKVFSKRMDYRAVYSMRFACVVMVGGRELCFKKKDR